jgi:hypothetical protein
MFISHMIDPGGTIAPINLPSLKYAPDFDDDDNVQ